MNSILDRAPTSADYVVCSEDGDECERLEQILR